MFYNRRYCALFPYKETIHSFDYPTGEATRKRLLHLLPSILRRTKMSLNGNVKAVDQVYSLITSELSVSKGKIYKSQKSVNHLADTSSSEDTISFLQQALAKYLSENSINNLTKRPYLIDDAMD